MEAATPAVTRTVGAGTGSRSRGRRERATARTSIAPTRAVKVTANTFSPGTAAPTAGPAAVVAATTTPVTSTSTGQPPAGGSHSVARTLLSANRHLAGRYIFRVVGQRRCSPTRDDRSGGRAIAFNYNSRRLQLSGETPLLPRRGDLP
jgi:hypothetical protein